MHHLLRRFHLKGHSQAAELVDDDSQGPDVALEAIALVLLIPHFRTDVKRRACSGLRHAALRKDLADVQISQLEAAGLVLEDIGRFDVPMRDVVLVKVVDRLRYVEKDPPYSILRNPLLLLLGLAQAFLAFPAALGDLVRLVVGVQDEDVVDWRPAVLVRLLAVLDFLHELVDEHVVELLVLDRDVVVLEVLDLLAHQLLPELALVLSLVFLERVVVVSVEDFQPLDLGVGLGAVGRPLRLSDHLLPLLLALVVLVALVLLRLSRADVGRGWLFLAHLALLLLPLTL